MYVYAHTRTLSCAFLSTSLFLIIYLTAYTKCLRRVPCFTSLFIYCTCLYLIRAHSYVYICVCVYKPLYTPNAITIFTVRRLCCLSVCLPLIRSFSSLPFVRLFAELRATVLATRSEALRNGERRRLFEFLAAFHLLGCRERGEWVFTLTPTEVLEKLASSLCLNPRVCEFLTCPSSCDGSRQSGGCVDVAWECVADERATTDERGKEKNTHR